jgi:hypothetical protein
VKNDPKRTRETRPDCDAAMPGAKGDGVGKAQKQFSNLHSVRRLGIFPPASPPDAHLKALQQRPGVSPSGSEADLA